MAAVTRTVWPMSTDRLLGIDPPPHQNSELIHTSLNPPPSPLPSHSLAAPLEHGYPFQSLMLTGQRDLLWIV